MATMLDPAALVANLGFLVRWDLADDGHDALLVVELRPSPTERHYDPEVITYWATGADGRGHLRELTVATPAPIGADYSWGALRIVDRFGVQNAFVSFGGTFEAERQADDSVIVSFRSPAPILRRGGHSQRYDQVAAEVTAFFGRLLVPIDFQPGAEQLINAAGPRVRYAAFLHHDAARLASAELVREVYGPDSRLVRAEAERLRRRDPDAWSAGAELLERIGIGVRTA